MTAGVVGIGVLVGDGATTVGGRGVAIWLIGGVKVDRATVAEAVEEDEDETARDERGIAGGRSVGKGITFVVELTSKVYHSTAPTTPSPQHKGITINEIEATLKSRLRRFICCLCHSNLGHSSEIQIASHGLDYTSMPTRSARSGRANKSSMKRETCESGSAARMADGSAESRRGRNGGAKVNRFFVEGLERGRCWFVPSTQRRLLAHACGRVRSRAVRVTSGQ